MQKIICAFDGLHFSESTLEYGIALSKRKEAHLVGVFLDDFTRISENVTTLAQHKEGLDQAISEVRRQDQQRRDEAVDQFTGTCQRLGLAYSVHRDKNIAIQDLLHESIYADLLIIEARASFALKKDGPPTPFLRELLSEVQCPVLVIPDHYSTINKIVYLYDGAPVSVHAIKMFQYLLPQLQLLDSEVVTVNAPEQSLHLPNGRLMKEFMKRHAPKADFVVLKGNPPEQQLLSYLSPPKADQLIVLGAYDRGRLSRWFKQSMADVLIARGFAPLFIAHSI